MVQYNDRYYQKNHNEEANGSEFRIMDTNATVRETDNNAATTVRENAAQDIMRESGASVSAFFGLQKFRDYNITQQLPTSGGESDIYVAEKGPDAFILKLYRYKIEPKIEVINSNPKVITALRKAGAEDAAHCEPALAV